MLLSPELIEHLLTSISDERPCGEDLEYDADFVALEAAARGKEEQQFGDTIIPAEEPDWLAVIQSGLALFERSKDLRVALVLLRGVTKTEGVVGFISGLKWLAALLDQYWEHIHPMLDVEDNNDSTMRLNALAPLSDITLVPRELRSARLAASRAASTLTLRDIELAYDKATPRAGEHVKSKTEVLAILGELAAQAPDDFATVQGGLTSLKALNAVLNSKLGGAALPDFTGVQALLYLLSQACSQVAGAGQGQGQQLPETDSAEPSPSSSASGHSMPGELRSREDALRLLDQVSLFLLRTEPGNPAPLLIERAKRLIGVSFMDIIADLAPEALNSVQSVTGAKSDETS